MPPKIQKEYSVNVKDQDHWNQLLNPDSRKLSVVDVYLTWCGPCSLMQSTYRTLALKIDEWEDRIQFLVADSEKIRELNDHQSSCMPKFLFFVGARMVAEVDGLNVPRITTLINKLSLIHI